MGNLVSLTIAGWRSLFKRHAGTEALDGWRAIAMLLLFIFHVFFTVQEVIPFTLFATFYDTTPAPLRWVWGGDRGVDIFFVLSGFLVSSMLLREGANPSWREFYWRRALRLLPVYYLLLLVYGVINGPNAESLWANVFFVNNYLSYEQGAMLWSWSLAVEVQFYLLAPWLIKGANASGRPLQLYLGALCALILWRAWIIGQDTILAGARPWQFLLDRHVFEYFFANAYDDFGMRCGSLLIGVIGAHLHHFYRERLLAIVAGRRLNILLISVCAAIVIALLFLPGWVYHKWFVVTDAVQLSYLIVHRYLFSAAVLVLLLGSILPVNGLSRWTFAWLNWPLWRPIARLSYSAYLVHIAIIFAVFRCTIDNADFSDLVAGAYWWRLFGLGLLALVGTWLVALILYLFVEFPFMRLRKGKT